MKTILILAQMIVAAMGMFSKTWNDFGTIFEVSTGAIQILAAQGVFERLKGIDFKQMVMKMI